MILGTPMISHIMNVIREREIDALVTPWVVKDDKVAAGVLDPTEYDEVVTTKDIQMIDAFSSHIIHVRTKIACTGARLNVMAQALCAEEGSLPQGLTIQNAYTAMATGKKEECHHCNEK